MYELGYTKVAGVCFKNEDGSDRQTILERCEEGMIVNLIPEPDNPYDENAVKVVLDSSGEQLGYINRHQAPDILRMLKYGAKVYGIIEKITGGSDCPYGCNLRLIGKYLSPPDIEICRARQEHERCMDKNLRASSCSYPQFNQDR